MAYGIALKKRVLDLYDKGLSTPKIAEQLLVSRSWARRVRQRRNEPPRKISGGKPKLDVAARKQVAAWVAEKPDATLEELRARVKAELNIQVSIGCMWKTLRDMKLTFKKSR